MDKNTNTAAKPFAVGNLQFERVDEAVAAAISTRRRMEREPARDITVKQLRDLLASLPDDAAVIYAIDNHTYIPAIVEVKTACYNKQSGWAEHLDGETSSADWVVKPVVVFDYS